MKRRVLEGLKILFYVFGDLFVWLSKFFVSCQSRLLWNRFDILRYPAITPQKIKFYIKDIFSKFAQIHSFLCIWSHLLKKSLMENSVFCAVHSGSDVSAILINLFLFLSLSLMDVKVEWTDSVSLSST